MKDRRTKPIIAKLEDEIDASEGTASLADAEGTLPLETYLKSREGDFVWWRDVQKMRKLDSVPASHTPIKNSLGTLKGKTSLVKELLKSRRSDAERGK